MVLKYFTYFTFFALVTNACSSSTESDLQVQQETPQEKGASLYSMHCAQCHGEDGKLGSSGAKDLSVSRLPEAQIIQLIKKGKNAMPPMEALLETQDNVNLVVAHIKTLRK